MPPFVRQPWRPPVRLLRGSPRPERPVRAGVAALVASAVVVLAACTPSGPSILPRPSVTAVPQELGAATVLAATDAAELAVQASTAFFAEAPLVIAAPTDDGAAQIRAASLAVTLGIPVLLSDAALPAGLVSGELARLGTRTVLTVGEVFGLPGEQDAATPGPDATAPAADVNATAPAADVNADVTADVTVDVVRAPSDAEDLGALVGRDLSVAEPVAEGGQVSALAALDPEVPTLLTLAVEAGPTPTPTGTAQADDGAGRLPEIAATERLTGAAALSDGTSAQVAAVGTARAAGADVLDVPSGDPRASSEAITALSATQPTSVVGLGAAFGPEEVLAWRAATAATGVTLPSQTQLVFQDSMIVALYGTPGTPSLGVLGEQGIGETITRAQEHAAAFEPYTERRVIPSLEIIASIASAGPGSDGNYSNVRPVADLRPLVDAAEDAGLYVVLDLQPGRTDFLTQARLYEDLLLEPHVGLALDPEWRLKPDQVHLRQIGSVGIDEVNSVVDYLADLTRDNLLPQKLLILHQFRLSMLQDRDRLDTSRSELAVMIHVDGQGTQPAKNETWRALRNNAPEVYWGWKNFYDEDIPMLTPQQTMQIEPAPHLISYQ